MKSKRQMTLAFSTGIFFTGVAYASTIPYAGLAAAIEIPCMILWGVAVAWYRKEHIILASGGVAAVYLLLAANASSVQDLIILQVPDAISLAALLSIPITYVQEVAPGRIGFSTSIYDVILVLGGLLAGGLFALTSTNGTYPKVFYSCLLSTLAGLILLLVSTRQKGQHHDH